MHQCNGARKEWGNLTAGRGSKTKYFHSVFLIAAVLPSSIKINELAKLIKPHAVLVSFSHKGSFICLSIKCYPSIFVPRDYRHMIRVGLLKLSRACPVR